MAKKLECWKKTIGYGGLPEIYLNNKLKSFSVRIDKYGHNWHSIVETINPRTELKHKIFKTKSQALKFANSYMRKHDRC